MFDQSKEEDEEICSTARPDLLNLNSVFVNMTKLEGKPYQKNVPAEELEPMLSNVTNTMGKHDKEKPGGSFKSLVYCGSYLYPQMSPHYTVTYSLTVGVIYIHRCPHTTYEIYVQVEALVLC